MYERKFTGAGYREGVWMKASEISARVRAGLRNAQDLGAFPDGMRFSVTCENYAGGRSVRVDILGMPDIWTYVSPGQECDYSARPAVPQHGGHSDAAKAVLQLVEEIRNAWNYDNSEVQVDYFHVNYYGHSVIVDEQSAAWRLAEKARQAARKAARAARKARRKSV